MARLLWFLCGAMVLAAGPSASLAGGKRARRPATNEPRGWVWPPDEPMERQGDECLIRLDERDVAFRHRRRRPRRIVTPVAVPDMAFGGVELVSRYREPPFLLDCHLALALARVGPRLRELGVVQLRFSSIHDFRNTRVNGTTKNTLSRHSYGLAVDIFEVVTVDGVTWNVEESYGAGGAAPPTVLAAVARVLADSGHFRTVLSPENDPVSHHDHLHLEARLLPIQITNDERRARVAKRRAETSSGKRRARSGKRKAGKRKSSKRRARRRGQKSRARPSRKRRGKH